MNQRRRLLYLAYWVPPRNAIGTLRSVNVLKHLPKFGWDITTVTAAVDPEEGRGSMIAPYVETGYFDIKGSIKRLAGIRNGKPPAGLPARTPNGVNKHGALRRIATMLSSVVSYPDDYVGWLPYAVGTTRRLIARGGWDAMLTSAPPMTTNLIAALSHGSVPWIADLRDLWAENDSSERTMIQALFDNRLERASLSRATALTAASELSAARFQRRFPGTPCFPIYNGFDAEEWQNVPFDRESRCTFVYAGHLYSGKRDPTVLFAALRSILNDGLAAPEEVRVDFYTPHDSWVLQLIGAYRLEGIVEVQGFVDRAAVLAAERRANRLLVLSWDGPTAEGVVAGKLFEYFGARRPVLAIGGPQRFAVEDLLRETGAGVRCRTVEETRAAILAALNEHRSGGPREIAESAVNDYRGDACAKRFADVLDRALGARV